MIVAREIGSSVRFDLFAECSAHDGCTVAGARDLHPLKSLTSSPMSFCLLS